MKAVIYARYSSDNQREESIEGQIRENTAYAQKNGIEIVGQYIDRAFSAKNDDRPDFQRMIRDSAKRKFDIVLVWKLDRFSRNRYDSAKYKSLLRKNGVKVVSATEQIADGSAGILMESVLEGMAEYYSAELSEKIRRGMTENALKCRYNGSSVPFGYRINADRYYEIDESKAPIVKEIFERYNRGDSAKEIVDDLNNRGVKTSKGKLFAKNSLHSIFSNRIYIGEYHYDTITVPGGVPAIVSEELFNNVAARVKANQRAPGHNKTKEKYILSSKLYCGDCMSLMTGESGKRKEVVHRYYKCISAKRHLGCKRRAVRKDWIEDLVIKCLVRIINDKVSVERMADELVSLTESENIVLPVLKDQVHEVEKALGNVMKAIEAGIISRTTKSRLTELEDEQERLKRSIAQEELKATSISKEKILFALERFRKLDLTIDSNRERLVNAMVSSIILYDDRIIITTAFDEMPIEVMTKQELEATAAAAGVNNARSDDEIIAPPKTQVGQRPACIFVCKEHVCGDSNGSVVNDSPGDCQSRP